MARASDGITWPQLATAAKRAITARLIAKTKTAWFYVAFIEVELSNQHPRTFRSA